MERSVYQQFYRIEKDHWWFVGMRAICRAMLDQVRVDSHIRPVKSLDVGCGTGLWTKELAADGKACGLDFSEDALAFCRERGIKKLVRASGVSLPFTTESYDIITTLGVIEHLDDDKEFLAELYRVCAPGGHILLLTSAYDFLWSRHDDIVHHKRRYTRTHLERLLAESGLEPVRISYVNTVLFVPIVVLRQIQRFLGARPITRAEQHGSPDMFTPPRVINTLLGGLLWIEARLLTLLDFPFGVGIVILARKSCATSSR